jgi:hypothetical protein
MLAIEHLKQASRPPSQGSRPMPIISSFFGIYIRMYFADHAPAHIHV